MLLGSDLFFMYKLLLSWLRGGSRGGTLICAILVLKEQALADRAVFYGADTCSLLAPKEFLVSLPLLSLMQRQL